MRNTEDHTGGQPQVGSDAVLEHLMAEKTAIEKKINTKLERMFPEGSRVTYKTWSMKHERWATVSRASLYCGSPYVCLYPDHNPTKMRRLCADHVSVL